jgi:hypothetical protein
MVYPYPNLPSIHVPREKQESLNPVMTEKPGTRESRVCSWAMPQITRGTATECGIQKQRRFMRHVMWCFSTGYSSEHLQCHTGNDNLDSV